MNDEVYRTRALNCSCRMAVCRCPVDYIVFYVQEGREWIVERTSDKKEMARGPLEKMMALVEGDNPTFPNGRRAHLAEDMLRWKPSVFTNHPFPDGT